MDIDLARWLLEFFLRKPFLEDRILTSLIRVLPLEGANSNLKLTLLLRKLESLVFIGVLSEEILELLELIEEMEHRDGIEVLESMNKAYCAVAVQCTVKFLEREREYFNAVKRIWRGRVWEMEKFENGVGLVSNELKEWRGLIEARVWDSGVNEEVLEKSSGLNGLEAVSCYVCAAKERIGPSFIEVLVKEVQSDEVLRNLFGLRGDIVSSVPNIANDQDNECVSIVDNTEKDIVTSGVCHVSSVFCSGKDVVSGGFLDQVKEGAPIVSSVPSAANDLGFCDAPPRVVVGKDRVTDGVCDSPSVPNARKDVVSNEFFDQVKESGLIVTNAEGDKEINKEYVSHSGRRRIPASITGAKSVDTEELACASLLKKSENETPKIAGKDVVGKARAPTVSDGVNVNEDRKRTGPSLEDTAKKVKSDDTVRDSLGWCADTVLARGRKIVFSVPNDANDQDKDCAPIVTNDEKDVVTRGVCNASPRVVIAGKDRVKAGVCDSPCVRNAGKDVGFDGFHDQVKEGASGVSSAGKNVVTDGVHDAPSVTNTGKDVKSDGYPVKVGGPTISSAGNDGKDVVTDKDNKEIHKEHVSRRRIPQISMKRKRKFWSVLEEDTLRAGVQKFGAGNWKLILNAYRGIFEDRTDGDLKDKWRNLMK